PSGNEIHLDENNKNMNFTSPETVTFNCKNFIINASEGITYNAGTDIIQKAAHDIDINAGGNINEAADNKSENIEKTITRSSHESTHYAEKVTILSTDENMLLESSQKTVEINSAEQSNFF
ncbi:hypothetical protein OIU83_03735, partial [Flavobacterium sp. LS1R49]|nr:hypothetical protein [Flavobacterium shii]